MDFVEGYLQGRMIRALEDNQELEDDAASARRQANEVIDKYNALVKMYYELEADRDDCAAARDAAFSIIRENEDTLPLSRDEIKRRIDEARLSVTRNN